MRLDLAREFPLKNQHSACPCCYNELIAKCGSLKIHHWAHVSGYDCDNWYEPMSAWHLAWQSHVKEACREVVIGEHRADIRLTSGLVFEIQHSLISVEEIEEREIFYGSMRWIFDAEDFQHNLLLKEKISQYGNTYYTFRWKRPRKSILACQQFPLYFDLGDTILEVRKFTPYKNDGDWGEYTAWYGFGYQYPNTALFHRILFGVDYEPPSPT